MGLFGKTKAKLKRYAMSKLLAIVLRKAAEGDFGPAVQKVYWYLEGKKTYTAAALAGVAAGLQAASDANICEPCGAWVVSLYSAAALLGTLGLVDAAVRIEPPKTSGKK